jgi:hypothetical protein
MKRILAVFVVLLLIGAGGIFWFTKMGSKGSVGGLPATATVTNPFNADFEFTEENFAFYTDGDTTGSVFGSSPFYFGKHPLPFKEGMEYENARNAKVEEIVGLSQDILKQIENSRAKRDAVKKALYDFLQVAVREEPKAEKEIGAIVKRIVAWDSKLAIGETMAKVYLAENSDDKYTKSMIRYLGVIKAVEASEAFFKGSVDMAQFAAFFTEGLAKSPNAKVAEAAKTLDSAMSEFDGLKDGLAKITADTVGIQKGFGQLAAADHRYALSAMEYIGQELPKLRKQLEDVKPNEYVPAEMIAATKAQLSYLNALQKAMTKALATVDESTLASMGTPAPNPFISSASATIKTAYDDSYRTLVTPAKTEDSWTFTGALKTGWSGLKTAVHGVQTGAGVILDTAGAAVKTVTRTGYGAYVAVTAPALPGKTRLESIANKAKAMKDVASDTWQDIKSDFRGVKDNYNNCTSGSQILKDAKAGFDAAEDYIDQSVSGAVEKTYGKGNLSWATGKVAKLGAGILTGLGKGISLVGNRQATTGDYAVGALELGGVLLGGSKVVIRGTQLPAAAKGLAEGGWLGAQRIWNGLGTWSMASFRGDMAQGMKFLKNQISKAVKAGNEAETAVLKDRLAKLTLETATYRTLQNAIRKSNAEIAKAFQDLIAGGLRAGQANAGKTLRESLTEVAETIFRKNVKEAGDAVGKSMKDTLVDGLKNTFDELVSEGLDDQIKAWVDEFLNAAPKPEDMNGKWTGKATFTAVVLPPAPPAGKKGDCDLGIAKAIKALEGKSFPSTFNMNMNLAGAGSGTITLTIKGKPTSFPLHLRYADGALSGSGGREEAALSFKGTGTRQEKGYELKGTLTVTGTGKGAGLKFVIDCNYSK